MAIGCSSFRNRFWSVRLLVISDPLSLVLPTSLFHPACLLIFTKFSFLHVYSNLHVYYFLQGFPSYMFIPTYTYIRDSRVLVEDVQLLISLPHMRILKHLGNFSFCELCTANLYCPFHFLSKFFKWVLLKGTISILHTW